MSGSLPEIFHERLLYNCSSNKSTINHHLCTRTTFEEVSQNEGPTKNPLNWLICVEILSGFRNASGYLHTHESHCTEWKVSLDVPAHHAKVQNMCDPQNLLLNNKTRPSSNSNQDFQWARGKVFYTIPTSSKQSLEPENGQILNVTFSIQKREDLQFLPPTLSICQHTILASKVTPQKGKTFYC